LNEAEKNRKKAAVGRGMQGMQLERGTTCSESLNCGNLGISQPPMFDAGELLLKALIAITSNYIHYCKLDGFQWGLNGQEKGNTLYQNFQN